MVYHTIVKTIAKKNFERVNVRDFDAILKDCAPNIKHRFGGSHSLGGIRNDKEALRRWFNRLAICGPGLKLEVTDIWVKGWPHKTTIFVRWSATDLYPDGTSYKNRGVHVIQMKWGKVIEIDAHEDSEAVAKVLEARYEEDGVKEAMAPQILS